MELLLLHSRPVPKSTPALNEKEIRHYLEQTPQWKVGALKHNICREFKFENYYQTLAFLNAIALVIHREDHHPDITLTYNRCHICFTTHSISGLSINDFICAAKIDRVFNEGY